MRNWTRHFMAANCLAAGLTWAPYGPAWAQGAVPGVSADRVLFGQSAKLSGTGGTELGKQYRDGLRLAFDAVNRVGGVHGRQLALESLDDEIDPDKTRENTRQLMDKGVLALVGYTFSSPVRAVLPAVRTSGVPFIAPYAGVPELYGKADDNVFVFRASVADELAAIVRHIDTVQYQDIAIVHYSNPLGEEVRKDVDGRLRALGRRLDASGSMPLNPKDSNAAARPAVAAISATCPKAVILAVSGRDAAAVVRAVQARGCASVRYFARHLVDIPMLLKELGPAARGVMVTQVVPNPHRGLHPLVRDYRDQQARRDGGAAKPDFTEFEGYIVGRFMAQALQRAGRDLDRRGFIRAMESTTLEGPGPYRVQFGAGRRVGSRYTNFVMVSDDGRITD